MNQKHIAGIGNLWSDEMLFQSSVNPERHGKDLTESELKEMYKNMRKILKKVIGTDGRNYPDDYLRMHREDGAKCPLCGGKIVKKKIGGRSSYFCREHQK